RIASAAGIPASLARPKGRARIETLGGNNMTNLRGLALVALLGLAGYLSAGDLYNKEPVKVKEAELPRPADVKSLEVFPAKIQLRGLDDAQQLVLTAVLNDGRLQDLTHDVRYQADAKVVRVTTTGRVVPVGPGT